MGGQHARNLPSAIRHYARRGAAEVVGNVDLLSYRSPLRSSDGLRLPDFIGIGAQKAGSTWLHENLSRHHQLFLPPEKELHYFDWFRVPTLHQYAERFSSAREPVAGELTPGYSALSERRVRRVRSLLPVAKVLLVLRDPIDRAWSQLVMDLARKRRRDPSSITAEEAAARLRQRGARRRSNLPAIVDRWSAAYGPQLWVGCYDDLAERPEALLREVFAHLGVDTDVDVSGWPVCDRFNAGAGSVPPPDVLDVLQTCLGGQREALRSAYPEYVARWERRR